MSILFWLLFFINQTNLISQAAHCNYQDFPRDAFWLNVLPWIANIIYLQILITIFRERTRGAQEFSLEHITLWTFSLTNHFWWNLRFGGVFLVGNISFLAKFIFCEIFLLMGHLHISNICVLGKFLEAIFFLRPLHFGDICVYSPSLD